MTKRGYKPTPEDAELPEKPPPSKHCSKVEPPKPWPEPPRSIPKPKPRPDSDTNGCIYQNECKLIGPHRKFRNCGTPLCPFYTPDPFTEEYAPQIGDCPLPTDQQQQPPAHPPKCVYKVPPPPPEREWLGRDARDDWSFGSPGVPDGMVCAGMFVRCADNCGPDCEDYRAVQPQQFYACTCSQQQQQPRPFVRVCETIIYLDDFSAFDVYFQPDGASVRGLDILGHWTALLEYGVVSEAIGLAQSALNAIQTAIERWNRAATEPERNVRLKSITRNLCFEDVKHEIEYRLSRMGFNNLPSLDTEIPIQALWTALEAVMTHSEKGNVP